ncbi:MAG: aldo/keto reductase [Zoogloea sp.]|uniref:aldo/keto reductase n=1 Tax=Zoogloea sp. TaxID=49181 RepID=UPI003F2FEFD6
MNTLHTPSVSALPQRPIGPLSSSALGLGCMGMSEFYGASDDHASLQVLARALERGITHFDSADTYGLGHNESLLGRFLAEAPERRAQVLIATKFGIVREAGRYERRIDNSPAYLRSACEASLRRLGVDCIDLYYCHRRDPAVPIEDLMGSLADLVQAGKIRAIGLSEVSAATLQRAHAVHPVAAVQSEYSLWSREPENQLLATCAQLGTAFVAYSPLGRAFLTGQLNPAALAPDDFRRHNPRFQAEAAAHNQLLVDALARFAAERGASSAQVALGWLLAKHPHVIPIPGTRKIARLEENAAACALPLSPTDLGWLDALFDPGTIAGARYPEAGMTGIESD